jgi:bacterioferritin (cytochrome b1)
MEAVDRAIEMLNEVLQRKLNSPATYMLEASPYVAEGDTAIVEAIEALRAADRQHAEEAARRILALEGAPYGGSYDASVADSNYLSVRYLLGQLLARLEADIALFEQYRDRCDVLEAKDFLTLVVEDDVAHRDRLKALTAKLEAESPDAATHRH